MFSWKLSALGVFVMIFLSENQFSIMMRRYA